MEVDVAILGGGPAGSTLAILLARRGLSVAIIDRDRFPRDKVCGEFLSYDALPVVERLGLSDALNHLGASSISTCRVASGSMRYEFPLPRIARGISRFRFDALLFETAIQSGALRFDGWTAELRNGLTLSCDEEREHLTTRVVVGAWGRWGRNDRLLDRPFVQDHAHRHFGFKRHYRGSRESDVIELHSFDRGYLGVATIENDLTNICGLVHESRLKGLKRGWESFTDSLAQEQPGLASLFSLHTPVDPEFLSSDPVIFVPKSAVERGIFMVGDAAGLIDPLTGNGMALAIQSALLAAPFVVSAVQGRSEAEEDYRARFDDFFGKRIWWSRRVAGLLKNPARLAALLRIRPPSKAGQILVGRTRATDRQVDHALQGWFGRL